MRNYPTVFSNYLKLSASISSHVLPKARSRQEATNNSVFKSSCFSTARNKSNNFKSNFFWPENHEIALTWLLVRWLSC